MAAKKQPAKPDVPAAEWVDTRPWVSCSRCGIKVEADAGPLLRAWKAEHEKECWAS